MIQARAKSKLTIEDILYRREKERTRFKCELGKTEDLGKFQSFDEIRDAIPDLARIRIIVVFLDDDIKVYKFITENTTKPTRIDYCKYNKEKTTLVY